MIRFPMFLLVTPGSFREKTILDLNLSDMKRDYMPKKKRKKKSSVNGSGEMPVFNIENRCFRDEHDLGHLQIEQNAAELALDDEAYDDMTLEMYEYLADNLVISVPSGWLAEDAPDDLDWSDPESYDWLATGKYEELVNSLNGQKMDGIDEFAPEFNLRKYRNLHNRKFRQLRLRVLSVSKGGDIEEYNKVVREYLAFVSQFVVSVPSNWVINGAADKLDWSDPESYFSLRCGCYVQLLNAMAQEQVKIQKK